MSGQVRIVPRTVFLVSWGALSVRNMFWFRKFSLPAAVKFFVFLIKTVFDRFSCWWWWSYAQIVNHIIVGIVACGIICICWCYCYMHSTFSCYAAVLYIHIECLWDLSVLHCLLSVFLWWHSVMACHVIHFLSVYNKKICSVWPTFWWKLFHHHSGLNEKKTTAKNWYRCGPVWKAFPNAKADFLRMLTDVRIVASEKFWLHYYHTYIHACLFFL